MLYFVGFLLLKWREEGGLYFSTGVVCEGFLANGIFSAKAFFLSPRFLAYFSIACKVHSICILLNFAKIAKYISFFYYSDIYYTNIVLYIVFYLFIYCIMIQTSKQETVVYFCCWDAICNVNDKNVQYYKINLLLKRRASFLFIMKIQ